LFDEARGRVIALSAHGQAIMWSLGGQTLAEFKVDGPINTLRRGFPARLAAVVLPPDGRLPLAIGHSVELRDAFDPSGARAIRPPRHAKDAVGWGDLGAIGHTHAVEVTDLAVTRDGNRLASSADDGTARIWSLDGGEEVSILAGHGAAIPAIRGDFTSSA